ncbi:aromatic-ring-hydroxylating dioxygenase subunit beta [Noviherbaspirillum saxi]|uniref:Phenylpropionate dioxygenase n=1 Tax=Noviherbaspirillum saxi TaxID=2320863 RepID=A0A3A3FM40_9BURK|nr:aromatic-ring-hydroxylating dioxygenase subunit beta [Noviherbaspirillum saxi]RJF95791.1 phenylpropionate dioxygenase [Noviherbaspirillum saxi]
MSQVNSTAYKPATPEQFAIAQQFLSWEAKLLDERRYWEWFDLIDDSIEYLVPLRVAKANYADETPAGAFRIFDSKDLIKVRIKRLDSGAAWAETPPSRTLRVVGSLLVQQTEQADVLAVESALIIYRQRGHDERGDIIPVRRQDQLRLTDNGARLLKRNALVTEVVLNTPNLGVFL